MTPKTFKVSKHGVGKKSCPRATGFSNRISHDQLEQLVMGDLLSQEETKCDTEQPSISYHHKAQRPEERHHDPFYRGEIHSTRKRDLVPASDHMRESNVSGDIEMSESHPHRRIKTTKNCCTLTDDEEAEKAIGDAA